MQCNRPSHPENKVAGVGLAGKSLAKGLEQSKFTFCYVNTQ